MKRKVTLLLLAASASVTMNSQVLLQENFTSPFNPTTSGWLVINNSVPSGTVSWTQGNQTGGNGTITAYNGATNDFYMADFMSVTYGQAGDISAWLITPPLQIYNGAELQFATRTAVQTTTTYPDRLQVRMDIAGSTSIPSGASSVGGYTNLLLDINPNLTTATSSVVSSGIVNGYPQQWAVYTLQVTGVTGTVTGRFAFRYYVTNGGSNGANSRLVGIDAVKYTLPCAPTVSSFTTCSGSAVTLNATGGTGSTTYSWSSGATTQSISVSPVSTTVYTLYPYAGSTACGTQITSTVTIGSQMSMSVSASSSTICSGTTVTLTATSPASTYSWNVSGAPAAPVITVTPSTTTTYSVGGANSSLSCFGGNTIQITVNASPSLSVALSPACLGGSITIAASGANTYTFLGQTNNPATFGLAALGATVAGGYNFALGGSNANGCTVAGLVNFTVNTPPTVQASATKTLVCINKTTTISATGADTYTWSGASTSTNSAFTFTAGSTAGTQQFSVVGTSTTTGCTAKSVTTVSVSLCTGIEKINGNSLEAAVYPNPFANQLTLTGMAGRVEIYNSLGQVVINAVIGENETINTSELAKGAYILKAYTNDNDVRTIKLLKNN